MSPHRIGKQHTNKKIFEKLYNRPLSNQEAFEANRNLIGFFDVLLKIDKRLNKSTSNRFDFSQSRQYSNANKTS